MPTIIHQAQQSDLTSYNRITVNIIVFVLYSHPNELYSSDDYTALAKISFINRIILNHLNHLSPIHIVTLPLHKYKYKIYCLEPLKETYYFGFTVRFDVTLFISRIWGCLTSNSLYLWKINIHFYRHGCVDIIGQSLWINVNIMELTLDKRGVNTYLYCNPKDLQVNNNNNKMYILYMCIIVSLQPNKEILKFQVYL